MGHSHLVVGFCMLGAMLWGCVGASEQNPAGQSDVNGDALVLSAADAKNEAPAPRAVDAGWAGACEAVANSTFRSVEPQYVSVGQYSGRMTFSLWFETARQGIVHWQHSDFVEDLNYHCEGFDIHLDSWSNRATGTLNPKSDVLTWDYVDYVRD